MQLQGFYQSPGRAARDAARLTLAERHLTLTESSGRQQILLLSEVQVSDALGTIPLTLVFPDGGRFVPEDDAVFRQWWQQRRSPGLVHRLERHRRGVLFTLLGTLAAIAFYVLVLLPAASREMAMHIPAWIERQVGEQTLTLLKHAGFKESRLPAEQQQRVERLFNDSIPPEMRHDATPLRLKIMHVPDGANAFMLSDGTLVVSDELVKLAKQDDGLAAVMLHEMGHHRYRHPMRMMVRSSLISLSYLWLTGDVSGIGDTLLQSASFVHQMQFSREMEREADGYAVRQMQAQGRSLTAMVDVYRQLAQAGEKKSRLGSLPEWLSTHPDMPERIKTIQNAQ